MYGNIILILIPLVLAVVFLFTSSRSNKKGRMVCTRCEGTGEVNEKWPDPDEPGGWHRLDGTCPKCKGKGRV